MKKYAGGSQGGDYEQYMKKYAGDYQQYMKKYTGGSQGGSQSQSGDYQQYMKKYAGGSQQGGDYQKYYQQYMKKYSGGGQNSASSTELLEQVGNTTQNSTVDQEKKRKAYVDQYVPADYQKYALSNNSQAQGGSQSQSGNYQQYMTKYAGSYQQYYKQYSQNQSAASSTDLMETKRKEYVNQFVPKDYQEYALSNNSQGGSQSQSGNYQQYMKNYAGQSNQSSDSSIDLSENDRDMYVKEYVPKSYQKKALKKDNVTHKVDHADSQQQTHDAHHADTQQGGKVSDLLRLKKAVGELDQTDSATRKQALRGQANAASQANLAQFADVANSSPASLALVAVFCVALACIVFFARRNSGNAMKDEHLLGYENLGQ